MVISHIFNPVDHYEIGLSNFVCLFSYLFTTLKSRWLIRDCIRDISITILIINSLAEDFIF